MPLLRNMSLKRDEDVIIRFLEKDGGSIFVYSTEPGFYKQLKGIIVKELGIDSQNIFLTHDQTFVRKELGRIAGHNAKAILVSEIVVNSKSSYTFIEECKKDYPFLVIIILSAGLEKDQLALLHEIGANNYIIIPSSMNNIIEKLSQCIRPKTEFGKLLDTCREMIAHCDFENALHYVDVILEKRPDSPVGLMLKGDALMGLGERKKALNAYESAHLKAAIFPDPLKKLADFYKDEQKNDEELKYLVMLDEISPLRIERKSAIGKIFASVGDLVKADEYFGKAIKIASGRSDESVQHIAEDISKYFAESDPELSEKYLRQGIDSFKDERNVNKVEMYNLLGIKLRKQGKYEESLMEYKKALRISPNDENIFYNMAISHFEAGQHKDAVQMLNEVISRNQDFGKGDENILFNMALIFSKAERKSEAKYYAEEALKLGPNNYELRKLLNSFKTRHKPIKLDY